MIDSIKKFAGWYLRSWLFLLWSVFCVCAGAAWMFAAVVAALPAQVRDMLL